jgi:hypothetical protein
VSDPTPVQRLDAALDILDQLRPWILDLQTAVQANPSAPVETRTVVVEKEVEREVIRCDRHCVVCFPPLPAGHQVIEHRPDVVDRHSLRDAVRELEPPPASPRQRRARILDQPAVGKRPQVYDRFRR